MRNAECGMRNSRGAAPEFSGGRQPAVTVTHRLPKAAEWRRNCAIRSVAVLLAIVFTASIAFAADAPEQSTAQLQRGKLLEQMRLRAQATKVSLIGADRKPELVNSPVFRYDDQPRHFIDATMWVWTYRGRPVAFEKIEAMRQNEPAWGYCFTSVAEGLIEAEWAAGRRFRATAPGVEFRLFADAPEVSSRGADRKLQARKLVRDFAARILLDDQANTTEAMRLLPTPIYEYSDPDSKLFQGAVFGFATSGTNPDLLIVIEPRDRDGQHRWHYAIARMTCGGVNLKYRDQTVWTVDFLPPRPTDLPNWTFFSTPREETP